MNLFPPPPTPNPQGVPPTNLQLSHTKGPPYPQPTGTLTHQLTTITHKWTPLPQPTGSTTHQLTTLTHKWIPLPHPTTPSPQGVTPTNLQPSHTNGPPYAHPIPLTHREYHPPIFNMYIKCSNTNYSDQISVPYCYHLHFKGKNDIFNQIRQKL